MNNESVKVVPASRSDQMVRPARSDDSHGFRSAVVDWLRSRLAPAHVELLELDVPLSNGMSAETYLIRLAVDGQDQRFVLRREPRVDNIFVDMENSHQAQVIDAVYKAGTAPVPQMIGAERDASVLGAPFFVMRFVEGRIPPDNPLYSASGWVYDLAPQDKARLWWSGIHALSGVSKLDWAVAGLSGLRKGATCGDDVEAELGYYLKLHRDHCDGHHAEFIASSARWLRANWPSDSRAVLVWGDARLGNMIFQDLDCAAIIDWEMSGIGAIERDLAWWLYIDSYYHEGVGVPRAAGWPSRDETIAEYERLTGWRMRDLVFYKAFAAFRSSVISARFTALGLQPVVSIEDYIPARIFESFIREA